jgi:uncharacterized membrane protein
MEVHLLSSKLHSAGLYTFIGLDPLQFSLIRDQLIFRSFVFSLFSLRLNKIVYIGFAAAIEPYRFFYIQRCSLFFSASRLTLFALRVPADFSTVQPFSA